MAWWLPFHVSHQESLTEQACSHIRASCVSCLTPFENSLKVTRASGSGPALSPSMLTFLLLAQVHSHSRGKGSPWELRSLWSQFLCGRPHFPILASVLSGSLYTLRSGREKGALGSQGTHGVFPVAGASLSREHRSGLEQAGPTRWDFLSSQGSSHKLLACQSHSAGLW